MPTHLSRITRIAAALVAASLMVAACGDDDDTTSDAADAPAYAEDASVTLSVPEGGSEVTSPVSFTMDFSDVTIATAGESVEGEGHMHLILDGECEEPGTVIPADDTHVHFGDASVEAELELDPGEYTVCLQLADGLHVASDVTDTVSFTVVE